MDGNGSALPDWFAPLCEEIDRELEHLSRTQPDHRPALEQEAADLRATIRGWSLSLAKPELDPTVREDLEAQYAEAKARLRTLEATLAGLDGRAAQRHQLRDPKPVAERLRRLADVLASGNVTLGNLELGRHIDRIDAYADGSVVMRTSKLGIFEGTAARLARPDEATPRSPTEAAKRVVPRRRARLRVDEPLSAAPATDQDTQPGLDPARFAGLGPEWFWEDTFEIPKPTYWAADQAAEVVKQRASGLTIEALAKHFGKTPPTIRKALRIGAAAQPLQELPRKMPRRRWSEDHAAEVMKLKQEGMSTEAIARSLGKSDTTIRAALAQARHIALANRPAAVDAGESVPRPGEEL